MLGLLLTGILISIPLVPPQVNNPFTLYEYMRANFTYQDEAEGVDEWKEPAQTAKDKGGDCEDMALYAQKVLQNLGYEAVAIAIKGKDKYFHAITIVKMENGKYRYFSNQYYSYFKDFESVNEIVEFECNEWKWWGEIFLPHQIKNFHHRVVTY